MPIDAMNAPPAPEETAPDLHGKVLYIEDSELNFQLVEAILARHTGLQLIHAATGQDGIAMVRSERPDFVLLDMHLPDISGLEVVRSLSETIAEQQLRITILTGDKFTMDVIKALSLGAFEYMVKPIESRSFEACVRRGLTAKHPDPSATLPRR